MKDNGFYNLIADFGSSEMRYLKKAFIHVIWIPLLFILRIIKSGINTIVRLIRNLSEEIRNERADFNSDLKIARKIYKNNKRTDINEKESSSEMIIRFIKAAFSKHKGFLKHSFNIILPITAILILLAVTSYNKSLDFALRVIYNDTDIGYIENEQVFKDAENIIKTRLSLGNQEYSSKVVSQPEYKISVVRPNELTDSAEICEKIIENSDSGLITACGVYIDGKFLCSVKNESDASYVFKNKIADYCKDNQIDTNNSKYMVDILEEIKYVQGLYSGSTVMTSEEIEEFINTHKKSESSTYTFKYGDSLDSILKKYKLSDEQFYALNPKIKKDSPVSSGTKLNVIKSIPYINITVSETKIETKEIKFDTIEIKTNKLYQGISKTVTEGVNGKKKITNLITYINGEKISEKEISSVITKKAVDEKIYIGTKPVPSFVQLNGVAEGTFIWPAVGVDYVTSEFGYRILYDELNFHRGLDISGAAALGKPIIASAAGTVELVTSGDTGYGYSVLIDHGNGVKTRYGHCLADSIIVNVGDTVEQGQMIAQVGSTGNSTGPHLHFEIIYNGAYTNPLDYLTR